jgi:acyl-CoA oxidase
MKPGTSGWSQTETMDTIKKERENPPFKIRAMSIVQHGSERDLILKERFMLEMSRDPVYYAVDIHDLSKDELRKRTMQKIQSLVHCVTNEPLDIFQKRMEIVGLFDPSFWTRFGVHYGLFVGAIVSVIDGEVMAVDSGSFLTAKCFLPSFVPEIGRYS